jgi:prepilin-type N-terminal cleavage/methylation domain-containing protein
MKRRHFTLVEIMIVVAIIGLLAAIAIPSFINARNQSRKNACINNLRQIDGAKEQYALANNLNTGDTVTLANLVGTAGYIKATPACPANGTYTVNAIGTNPACSVAGHALP